MTPEQVNERFEEILDADHECDGHCREVEREVMAAFWRGALFGVIGVPTAAPVALMVIR